MLVNPSPTQTKAILAISRGEPLEPKWFNSVRTLVTKSIVEATPGGYKLTPRGEGALKRILAKDCECPKGMHADAACRSCPTHWAQANAKRITSGQRDASVTHEVST